LATLDIFDADRIIENNRAKAERFNQLVQPLAQHSRVQNFRNTGMIWAFEVNSNDPSFAHDFYRRALEKELLLRPIGTSVYFMPPYVIEDAEMRLLVERTLECIDAAT
jgi:adenosylmethionine-8-amino-7-oxononanoate aminotransferase